MSFKIHDGDDNTSEIFVKYDNETNKHYGDIIFGGHIASISGEFKTLTNKGIASVSLLDSDTPPMSAYHISTSANDIYALTMYTDSPLTGGGIELQMIVNNESTINTFITNAQIVNVGVNIYRVDFPDIHMEPEDIINIKYESGDTPGNTMILLSYK